MRSSRAFIGLGSNLAMPEIRLRAAIDHLAAATGKHPLVSSLYRTEPVGGPPQPWYVNAVAAIVFSGEPLELLRMTQSIERHEGRERSMRNAPRTLDLDLLLLGDAVIQTAELSVPHPRLHLRRFVLEPLVEIAPDVVHPVLRASMRELLGRCPDRSRVFPISQHATP